MLINDLVDLRPSPPPIPFQEIKDLKSIFHPLGEHKLELRWPRGSHKGVLAHSWLFP